MQMLFTSQNLPHKQINGTPMASPTSGLIADFFLQKLEANTLETRKPSFLDALRHETFTIIKLNRQLDVKNQMTSNFTDIQLAM